MRKPIDQEGLKLIAAFTMLIDHIGAFFVPMLPFSFMPQLYYTFRMIGRLAFPIYAFLIAEGMKHTGNKGKYLLRLAIGFVLSELPFDMLLEGQFTWERQNVMLTLLLGAGMLAVQERVKPMWGKALLILPFAFLADLCRTDYGGMGVVMIAVFSMADALWIQTLGMAMCNLLLLSADVPVLGMNLPIQPFAVPAMLFIWLYSGKKLTRSRWLQWAFYLFYPVHLLVLWLIIRFIR